MTHLWTDTTGATLIIIGCLVVTWLAVRICEGVYREWMRRRIQARRLYRAWIGARAKNVLDSMPWRKSKWEVK